MLIALVRTAVFWAAWSSLAGAACDSSTIVSPTPASTLAESRPVFRWSPVPNAERYRVRLRSQIPNGEILHDIDTLVLGTAFTPAVALSNRLASVRVVVSPDCAPAFLDRSPPLFNEAVEFWVNPALSCAAPEDLVIATVSPNGSLTLRWRAANAVNRYEITLFSGAAGEVIRRVETSVAFYPISAADAEKSSIASVRARCTDGWSEPQQIAVSRKE